MRKNTKRALILSCLSLLLCVSMLVGTTFAWFTDEAQTGVNTIQAGTLDIDLVDADGTSLEGKTIGFTNYNAGTDYWEPGARYTLEEVKLKNNGNLHAKYRAVITAVTGDVDLSQVIDVYEGETKLGPLSAFLNKTSGFKEGTIGPGQTLSFGTLTLVMQTTAGNEYQGKSIDNIAITVYATQAPVESDSFDNQYDAGALYSNQIAIADQDELKAAFADASTPDTVEFVLADGTYDINDVTISKTNITFTGSKNAVFDMSDQENVNGVQEMNGKTLTFNGVTVKWSDANEGYQGIKNPKKVVYNNCTIEGTQFMYSGADFINCEFKVGSGYAVYTRASGDYTFTNCTFTTGGRAIMMYSDSPIEVNITVTNCSFSDNGTYTEKPKAAIETGDTGSASKFNIVINGCTTQGFEENDSTSNLWGNKNSMPKDRLNVILDGEDVY